MIKKAFAMVSLFLMSVLILSACGTLRDTADKNEKLNETLPYYELNTADYSEISYDWCGIKKVDSLFSRIS